MANQITNVHEYEKDFRSMAFGEKGFEIVTAGDADNTKVYRAITALTDTDITLTQKQLIPTAGAQTMTILAGTTIFGIFDPVTGITGTAILYIG